MTPFHRAEPVLRTPTPARPVRAGRLSAASETWGWSDADELIDLGGGEAANSVAVLNALVTDPVDGGIVDDDRLHQTSLTWESRLTVLS